MKSKKKKHILRNVLLSINGIVIMGLIIEALKSKPLSEDERLENIEKDKLNQVQELLEAGYSEDVAKRFVEHCFETDDCSLEEIENFV